MHPHPTRLRVDQTLLSSLPRHLTERDRHVLRLLHEHHVLTTNQILDIGFDASRRCRRRMLVLYRYRLVDRFRPQTRDRTGSAPHHWVLDRAGAHVIAAELGTTVKGLGWNRDEATTLARNERLQHLVGINGFFTSLVRATRGNPAWALDTWRSERECARRWGRLVRPDGYGVWVEGSASLPFLLEYDRGTEAVDRLGAKLDGYARLQAASGHPTAVLFAFENPRREANARSRVVHPMVPTATAVVGASTDPTEAIWQVGDGSPCRLIDLVSRVLAKHRVGAPRG